jgi:hypothetical protein
MEMSCSFMGAHWILGHACYNFYNKINFDMFALIYYYKTSSVFFSSFVLLFQSVVMSLTPIKNTELYVYMVLHMLLDV